MVLLGQIIANYLFARRIQNKPKAGWLLIAVLFNLALLGYFKYRNFFLENVAVLYGTDFHLAPLVVPLAISFHTFQQIALLVDVRDEEAVVPPFLNYLFFVVFFPQLIAGPIGLHREMARQVSKLRGNDGPGLTLFGCGLFLFCFGLFKKVCLADSISTYVDIAFQPGQPLQCIEAWCGSIAYGLQLYFDFSGYSDMAVGLGCMVGFRLPNNFLVPFAAKSMIDYWKRWHITMTRFFTMYTYIPMALAAARYSESCQLGKTSQFLLATAGPTFVTFLLSGFWHGAGWHFVFFGLANGLGLLVNHVWIAARLPRLPKLFAWAITMINVLITFVFFRSETLKQSFYVLHQMFLPDRLAVAPSWLVSYFPRLHVSTTPFLVLANSEQTLNLVALIVFLGPLSLLIPALSAKPEQIIPSWRSGFVMAGMVWLVLGMITQPRSFLYFAF